MLLLRFWDKPWLVLVAAHIVNFPVHSGAASLSSARRSRLCGRGNTRISSKTLVKPRPRWPDPSVLSPHPALGFLLPLPHVTLLVLVSLAAGSPGFSQPLTWSLCSRSCSLPPFGLVSGWVCRLLCSLHIMSCILAVLTLPSFFYIAGLFSPLSPGHSEVILMQRMGMLMLFF